MKEGTHRYLVYFRKGENSPRSNVSFWTRIIKREIYNNTNAIVISQIWEAKDTITHTVKSVSNAITMQSMYSESWWKDRTSSSYDFINNKAEIDGYELNDYDTNQKRLKSWNAFKKSCNIHTINWHIDLEVFPILPYKENVTFIIPFYDPGFSAPKNVMYSVNGSAKLKAYENENIDCWLLIHESENNKETFWISKKTKEVLKLEQQIKMADGSFLYRYKIKLGFSN